MTAGASTGFIMAKELNERTKTLKEIEQGAINIKSELKYRASEFTDCFNHRGKVFDNAATYIREGMLPDNALKKACEETDFLKKEDKDIIFSYADNLSAEDIGGQLANIDWLIDNLRKKIKESEEECASKGRLYKSCGILAGLGVVIFLL